jgi:hypothetical protein
MAGQYQHLCRPSGQLVRPLLRGELSPLPERETSTCNAYLSACSNSASTTIHARIAYDSPGLGTLADGEHANENAQPGYSGSR